MVNIPRKKFLQLVFLTVMLFLFANLMSIHWLNAKVDFSKGIWGHLNGISMETRNSLQTGYRDLFPSNSSNDFEYFRYTNLQQINDELSIDPYIDKADRLWLQLNTRLKNVSKDQNTYSILVYFNDKALSNTHFLTSSCSVNNCRFKKMPEDFETADAVLFKEVPVGLRRPQGKPKQTWIYYQLESPVHTRRVPRGITVNWTATYRKASVLPAPYGKIARKNADDLTWISRREKNYAKTKTKLIAWFVSNCQTDNGRMNYVRELQKHVEVHIYGDCGTRRCGRNERKCGEMLRRQYKFYLAFENSNCREYITEKLFNAYT